MTGSIKERSPGHWQIRIYRGEHATPKQTSHTVRGTKKDAEKELRRLLRAVDTGEYTPPSKQTLAAYLPAWLHDSYRLTVSPKQYENTGHRVRHILLHLGEVRLDQLTAQQVQAFYTRLSTVGHGAGRGPLAPKSVELYHATLSAALGQAVEWGLITRNPAAKAKMPRPSPKPVQYLDTAGVNRMLAAIEGEDLYLPTLIAVLTGLRRGEVLALRWGDVDLKKRTLTVEHALQLTRAGIDFKEPKNLASRRLMPLPELLIEPLRKHKGEQSARRLRLGAMYKNHDLIVCTPDGRPLHPDVFSARFPRVLAQKGLPRLRFHDLRHTHATMLITAGAPAKAVQQRMGHSSYQMTMDTYSHVSPATHRELADTLDTLLGATGTNGP